MLLPNCANYQIGSLTAIEIWPGEEDQELHLDDSMYPLYLPDKQLQISAMWALNDFTAQNDATVLLRLVLIVESQSSGQYQFAASRAPIV